MSLTTLRGQSKKGTKRTNRQRANRLRPNTHIRNTRPHTGDIYRVAKRSNIIYPIMGRVAKANRMKEEGKTIYPFHIGDPCSFKFKPPQHIITAAEEAPGKGPFGYTPSEGLRGLRKTIAAKENVSVDDVFVTAGLSEGIEFLFLALLEPGDNILVSNPTYPRYLTTLDISITGGKARFYECDENRHPKPESVEEKITTRTRLIVVNTPNNPTGAVYPEKVLKEIAETGMRHKIPVFLDLAYDRLVLDGKWKKIKWDKNLPVIRGYSMSKEYIWPGLRMGWIVFNGKVLEPVRTAFKNIATNRVSVNVMAQQIAIAALNGDQSHINNLVKELKRRRDDAYSRLKEVPGITCVKPEGAFYAWAKVNGGPWKTDDDFVDELLEKTGILVANGSGFSQPRRDGSPGLDGNYFRMVYLVTKEKLDEAFKKFNTFMKKHI